MYKKIYNIFLYGFAIIGFILIAGFVISKSGLTNKGGLIDDQSNYFSKSRKLPDNQNYNWINTEEYISLKEALDKEQTVLNRVEKEIGIRSRLLVSILFVEQMRLYNSDRELFKKIFEPLKMLGVQSQFSWGVLGLKEETLIQIENNLQNSTSTFYLGLDSEKILNFSTSTTNKDAERFNRVTDEHNHYYSYLYAGLFLKQIEKQWQNAGFDISNKPEIQATLYNIGFSHSLPNPDPKVGGAQIKISDTEYSFGRLAYEFYYSNELLNEYPR